MLFIYDSPDALGLGGSILKQFPNELITDQCVREKTGSGGGKLHGVLVVYA